jgi:hypothetical protein
VLHPKKKNEKKPCHFHHKNYYHLTTLYTSYFEFFFIVYPEFSFIKSVDVSFFFLMF